MDVWSRTEVIMLNKEVRKASLGTGYLNEDLKEVRVKSIANSKNSRCKGPEVGYASFV